MKKATNQEEAWKIQETYEGKPHAWIQWKGTSVCMDVYCACGNHFHIDAEFAYNVKCPSCKLVYMCNGHIELVALEQEPDSCVIEGEHSDYEIYGKPNSEQNDERGVTTDAK